MTFIIIIIITIISSSPSLSCLSSPLHSCRWGIVSVGLYYNLMMSFEISSERPENQFKYPAWGPFTSLGTRSQIKSSEPVKSPALQGADPRPTSLSLPLHTDLSILVVLESDKQVLPMFPPPSLPQGRSEARVLGHRHLWATPFLGKPFVMEGLSSPSSLFSILTFLTPTSPCAWVLIPLLETPSPPFVYGKLLAW